MRPGEQQYLHAQQQQHQQQGQHQAALQLNSAGFSPLQQQHSGNPAAFLPPHYAQLAALNRLQGLGGMGPMGGVAALPGMQRGFLPMQQDGLLQHHRAQLRLESQAWGSGVFPASQQGLIQANYAQQHIQQHHQVASSYSLQDLRSASVGLNGMPLPAVHGDGLRGTQQWAHPHDVQGQYGGWPQDLRRPQDGMRPADFSSNGTHGNGHLHGNGNSHNKGYDKNNRSSGNWP